LFVWALLKGYAASHTTPSLAKFFVLGGTQQTIVAVANVAMKTAQIRTLGGKTGDRLHGVGCMKQLITQLESL
jgi:hypothetical protein